MLTFLLDCGANPNATTVTPSQSHAPGIGLGAASVLTAACALDLPSGRHGAKVIKLLLDRGAAVDAALPSSPTRKRNHQTRRDQGSLLLPGGQGGGQTAIHIATLAGNSDALEELLGHGGADVNRAFDAGVSAAESWEPPAHSARGTTSWKGSISLARHRRAGSKDTTTTSSGTTSSSSSSSARSVSSNSARSSAEMMMMMMMMGMKNPVTALHLAHASPACARVLLAHGADFNVRDGHGRTPTHWAAEFGSVQVVKMLLDAGAEADAGAGEDPAMPTTPLGGVVAALESGAGRPAHVGVARLLIGQGAEVEGNGLRERLLAVDEWKHIFEDMFRGGDQVKVGGED